MARFNPLQASTVKRSNGLSPPSPPARPHRPTRRVPCENSEISQTPATRVGGHPRPISATRVGGELGFRRQTGLPRGSFLPPDIRLDAGHGSQRSARLCAGPCPALERASERRQDRPHRLQHHAQTHRVEARRQFVVTLLCSAVGARRAAESAPLRQPSRAAVVKSLLWRWRCAAEWGGRCRCPIYCVCARALLALKKTHALARLPPHAPDSLVHPGISASSVR